MREYESIFVLDPGADEAQVDAELDKIREFLSSQNSEVTEIQKWGRRKMAYEVNKNKEGVYTLIRFNSEPQVPTELNRRYRLNENMLRYLTVLYEKPPVVEGVVEGDEAKAHPGEKKAVDLSSDPVDAEIPGVVGAKNEGDEERDDEHTTGEVPE
jgi:small subunit ribosomal protein S6